MYTHGKNMSEKKKKLLKIIAMILFIGAMAAIIALTAVKDFTKESVDLGAISDMIGRNWYYLLALLGLFLGTLILESLKLFLMLRKTCKQYRPITAINCAVIGKYYDNVTPLGSGGQPFQMYYLAKHGVSGGPASAIPVGSLFLTQFAFFICAVVCFIVGVDESLVPMGVQIVAYIGAFLYAAVPGSLLFLSLRPGVGNAIVGFGVKICAKLRICKDRERWLERGKRFISNNCRNMAILFTSKRVLIVCSLFAIALVIVQCSMPYFTLLLFSGPIDIELSWEKWFEILRVSFFIYSAIVFAPTPGNSGAADGTFYGLFETVLTVAGTCFTGMMIWRIFSFYGYIAFGIIFSIGINVAGRIRKKRAALSPSPEAEERGENSQSEALAENENHIEEQSEKIPQDAEISK